MSVINKMLRDLDHRQLAQAPQAPGTPVALQTPLRQGTSSIGRASGASHSKSRRWVGIGLFGLLAAAGVGGWVWMQANPDDWGVVVGYMVSAPVAASTPASAASVNVSAAASVPVGLTAVAATPPHATPSAPVDSDATGAEGGAVPGAMVLRMEESLSARRALDALLSTPAPAVPLVATAPLVAPTPERAKARAPVMAWNAGMQSSVSTANAPAATAQSETAPVVQRQQQAGGDAIAQAQNLWNTGSHDAAIDLMQQSIAAAERAAKAAAGSNSSLVLVPLVREMARMQLAQARYGAVWEMLTRLELQLGNQPDLWAIRANAAQRLGRHQDSVHAYMVALQSRPDEQRWLLGTAVSLAALGQTGSAAEMTEKARAVGPISKDILAYLRQAGVVFKD